MEKISYLKPEIKRIELDNEITLMLQSEPPTGPLETNNLNFNNGLNA